MESVCLIAGLGNPGKNYARTRHNAGFLVLDELARRWRSEWREETRFKARMARGQVGETRVWLCQPLTYMNLSGEAVRLAADYYQVTPPGLVVAVDDADLPLGELRMRPKGGPGGHHGLESVQQHLGTSDFPRLRIGIGRQAGTARQLTGHVLGQFDDGEKKLLEEVLAVAANQLECWLAHGIERAMNQFNGVINDPQ